MKKHKRNNRLTRGERTAPDWVAARLPHRPNWSVNRQRPDETRAAEAAFKSFIFTELDRRIGADIDALAARAQSDETAAMFEKLAASDWKPEPRKKPDGREIEEVVRRLLPAEEAARLTTIVREIFEDYWGKWNRSDPSPEQISAEYVGISVARVRTRKKRSAARRPSK